MKLMAIVNPSTTKSDGILVRGKSYYVEVPGVMDIDVTEDPAGDAARALLHDQYSPFVGFSLMEKGSGRTVFVGLIGETANQPWKGGPASIGSTAPRDLSGGPGSTELQDHSGSVRDDIARALER